MWSNEKISDLRCSTVEKWINLVTLFSACTTELFAMLNGFSQSIETVLSRVISKQIRRFDCVHVDASIKPSLIFRKTIFALYRPRVSGKNDLSVSCHIQWFQCYHFLPYLPCLSYCYTDCVSSSFFSRCCFCPTIWCLAQIFQFQILRFWLGLKAPPNIISYLSPSSYSKLYSRHVTANSLVSRGAIASSCCSLEGTKTNELGEKKTPAGEPSRPVSSRNSRPRTPLCHKSPWRYCRSRCTFHLRHIKERIQRFLGFERQGKSHWSI